MNVAGAGWGGGWGGVVRDDWGQLGRSAAHTQGRQVWDLAGCVGIGRLWHVYLYSPVPQTPVHGVVAV